MLTPHKVRARLSAVVTAGLAAALVAAPALATNDETTSVAVRHVNLAPETGAQADRLLNALSEGAMEACGASSFSVKPYRQAVRRSACWRTSMTDVVQRIDNSHLTAAFVGHGMPSVITSPGDSAGGR